MSKYTEIKNQVKDIVSTTHDIEELRGVCRLLLNMVEELAEANHKLATEVQDLRDEVNRLKGEKGKPKFRAKPVDHSSEDERKPKVPGKPDKKPRGNKNKLKITRKKICPVDPTLLTKDAIFKGYQRVVVQDLILSTETIEFRKEVYYSPSAGKNFTGTLPAGYKGSFGPNIKTLILSLHNTSNMTESAIVDFLTTHGVVISSASVARIILDGYEQFKDEKSAIIDAGLVSTPYQHIDDTGAKVDGKQNYTHVLCNPFYTAYFTRPNKSRLTLLEILSGGQEFRFDDFAYTLMTDMSLPAKALNQLKAAVPALTLTREDVEAVLYQLYPDVNRYQTAKRIILESSAIAAYRSHPQAIQLLICDDAPQFKQITPELALCWVHEGRHYKKLTPIVTEHRQELNLFLNEFWNYYRKLLEFKDQPTQWAAAELSARFDTLFNQPVRYSSLAERMKKTVMHRHELLTVLRFPEVPLHNNPAEHGARAQARKRDISFHTKTDRGTLAKDTMMTIVQTAKKLGVNVYQYIYDRVSQAMSMPSLADAILMQSSIA